MRVAMHAGQLLQPVPGGIGRYIHALLRLLPAAGVEATAFAAGARPDDLPAATPWVDLGWPHGSVRYEMWNRVRRPRVALDADLLHAPSLAVPPPRTGPLVVTVHDVAFLRVPHVTTRRGLSFHRRGLEITRHEADLVLTPSAFTRSELLREGFAADDIVLTPLGVAPPLERDDADIDATVAGAGVRTPYVLTVGTVEPRKDLPTMVAAVARLRRHHPDVELVVVGPPGWGEVTDLDAPFVRVLGELPWSVVDALYRRALVCCVASRYEGFGLPAAEALARGAPVIAADGSALSEVVGDGGVLFPAGDIDRLADELQHIAEDGAHRTALGTRARRRAAELSWPRSAAAHAEAYGIAAQRHRERGPRRR